MLLPRRFLTCVPLSFLLLCRGKLSRDDFELLLMALGFHLTSEEIDACFADMGIPPNNGALEFDLFFEWWTDSHGVAAIRRKSGHK